MEKLQKIQAELKAPKNQRNNFGKYNYRSCEDILEAVKPLIEASTDCTLTISDEIKELGGILFVESVSIISDGENQVHVQKHKLELTQTEKEWTLHNLLVVSCSYARKYCLNGLFLIDDTKDADATNTHGKASKTQPDSDKQWLNKGTAEFKKVQAYIKGGGKLDKVEAKYRISKETKELLNK